MLVYQKSLALADEVSVLLKRPSRQKDFKLRDQLGASSESVPSLIAEGFGQKTDRLFAAHLYRARGSSKEKERDSLQARYNEVEKMLTGLANHLIREDRRQRGLQILDWHATPDSRLPTLDSRLPTLDYRLPTNDLNVA